jgi:hypothetical protein
VRSATTGQLRLLYPESAPWATGMIALVVDIDPVGYNANTYSPLCFLRGTGLAAPGGAWRAAGDVEPGERLLDRNGYPVRVLARIALQEGGPASALTETIRLPDGAGLSRQHRVTLSGPAVHLLYGRACVLAPAVALADAGLATRQPARAADYVHILTERHAVLLAEGTEAESLLLGTQARQGLEGAPETEEGILSDLGRRFHGVARRAALPVVSRREAALLIAECAAPVQRAHPERRIPRGRAA